MKEERLKKEKQDMLGFYDYTVVLTYISLAVSVFEMCIRDRTLPGQN